MSKSDQDRSAVRSVDAMVRERADRMPEALAFTFLDDDLAEVARYRYADVDRRARAVAAALAERVQPGDRALLVFPPGLEFMEAFFGCLYAGVIAVPVYPPDPRRLERSVAKLRALARDAGPAVVLSTSLVTGLTGAMGAAAPEITALPWITVDTVADAQADGWRERAASPDDLAFLQYTSGSTSEPKGVMVSHGDVLANEELQRQFMGHRAGLVLVGWLPLYHDMGLIGNLLQPLYVGGVSHLMSPTTFLRKPIRWLEAITRYRPGTSGGPNFAYELCLRKISPAEREGLDLSSLEVMVNAAEPLRADTIERFCRAFAPCGFRPEAIYPCYGLAEATLIAAGSPPGRGALVRHFDQEGLSRGQVAPRGADPGARSLVGSGRLLPGQSLIIVDPGTTLPCPPDRIGEIWLAGPSITRGYHGDPARSRGVFGASLAGGEGPYLRTGDLGFLLEGELFVTGRLKDVLIIRGANHYPQDIEQTVERSHAAIRGGCVVALGVPVAGEERLTIIAEIEPARAAESTAILREIRRAVAEEHGLAVQSVALLEPGGVPKTSSGKLQRQACKAAFLAGSLAPLAADTLPEEPRPRAELILLSASSAEALAGHAIALADSVRDDRLGAAEVAYTLAQRPLAAFRAAFAAAAPAELDEKLGRVAAALRGEAAGEGVWVGHVPGGAAMPTIALLFPGQGAQSPGLCQDLYRDHPVFRGAFQRCEQASGGDLAGALYPAAGGDRHERALSLEQLTRTEVCQPAMAAVSRSLSVYLAALGVEAEVVLGHSLGEFVAAADAGVIDEPELMRWVTLRGRAMGESSPEEPGAMAAVAGPHEVVASLIASVAGVVVANRNHPHQTVISGRSHAVAEACRRLADAGLASTPLRVSHAFHSPEMEAASQALVPAVDALPLRPQDGRWFSCITGGRAPSKEPEIRAIFARHACVAVDFESAVRAAAQAGVDTWVQLGAGHALLSMVQATLAASGLAPRALLAIGSVGDAQGRPFIDALARLSALGVDLDPGPLFEGRSLSPCALPAPPRIARDPRPVPAHGARVLFGAAPPPRPARAPQPASPPEATGPVPPAPAPLAPARPTPASPDRDTLRRVLAVISGATAYPVDRLRSEQHLAADLGGDSLIMTEISAGLARAFPGVSEERLVDLLAGDPSIADLVRHLDSALPPTTPHPPEPASAPPSPPSPPPVARPLPSLPLATGDTALSRWTPQLRARPVRGVGPHAALPTPSPVLIVADTRGVAGLLADLLAGAGLDVRVSREDSPRMMGVRSVIDLRALDERQVAPQQAEMAALTAAIQLARQASQGGPLGALVLAHRGARGASLDGLAKALAREWPRSQVRSISTEAASPALAAQQIAAELAVGPGAAEIAVSWGPAGRRAAVLVPEQAQSCQPLSPGEVVVISGGAGSIGQALAGQLAARGARVALLGRRPATAGSALVAHLGDQARYLACDLTRPSSVRDALDQVRRAWEPPVALVHAAASLADGPLGQIDEEAIERVLGAKLGGAWQLWSETRTDPLRACLLLGSWSGRYGNSGQAAYGAASAALGAVAARMREERPAIPTAVLELPPVEGSSMVASIPAVARQELERAGVPFVSLGRAAASILDAIERGPGASVVLLSPGVPPGGEPPAAASPASPLLAPPATAPPAIAVPPRAPSPAPAGGRPPGRAPTAIEAFPEVQAWGRRLLLPEALGIENPYFNLHERVTRDTSVVGGREVLSFAAYNYLGLSGDPRVSAAAIAAIERYGTSVSASRIASGEKPLHRELEGAIARFLGAESALVFVSGHATNVTVLGHLLGPQDLVLHDALAHDSIVGGVRLSGARRRSFPHNDVAALDALLAELGPGARRVLIAVEGAYSMDGDIAPLREIVALKKKHGALLFVDEAHSIGVLGATGRGIGELAGVARDEVDLWMGTLSKSLASCGGYIASSRKTIEYLQYTTPGFVYSVGIPPASAASALEALRILEQEPWRVATLQRRAAYFLDRCRAAGIDTGLSAGTGVIPCIIGRSLDSLRLSDALMQRGINVQPILYPAVDENAARLRFFVTSLHTEEQLDRTVRALTEELSGLDASLLARPSPTTAAHAPTATAPSVPRIAEASAVVRSPATLGKVLVTGGSGFIGSRVVALLRGRGYEVRCLLREQSDVRKLAGQHYERATGDVRDREAVARAARGCGAVIHLACVSAWADIRKHEADLDAIAVEGTRNVLDAAREAGVRRVVQVSSVTALTASDRPEVFDEEAPYAIEHLGLAYSLAKHRAARLAARYAAEGLDLVTVMPAEVYGPGDDALVTAGNIAQVLEAFPAMACDGGTSVAHVDDVADGIIAALERGRAGERYILGGENLTIRQLIETVLRLGGRTDPVLSMPNAAVTRLCRLSAATGVQPPIPLDVLPYATRYWFVDSAKARRELGYRPRGAVDTLAPVVRWLRETGRVLPHS